MQALSRVVPIYYIEDSEDSRWLITRHQVKQNVVVVRGLMPAWVRFERRGWLCAQKLWAYFLRDIRKSHRRIILWEAMNWLRCFRYVDHDLMIYDSIDPCFSEDPEELSSFNIRERQYFARADVVFASANALQETAMLARKEVFLVNNACEPGDYTETLIANDVKPSWWPAVDRPVAAYLGSLDARFDFSLIHSVAQRMPDIQFVLAGIQLREFGTSISELRALPNVTLPGLVSLADGRYLMSRCQVGLIPFTPGAMNDAINPVKMYAYAYLGKPMVGTSIRELVSRPDLVYTANSADHFAEQLRNAIRDTYNPRRKQSLRLFGEQNTWEHRADQVVKILSSKGLRF
jgi:glycosyltransferase involved in cell wall biosynthesis